ncbi:hypothetical protein NMY22_g10596 [Coprinellus aureogranulatus]|nr:hypothetical protein NMY22_g10596 [Coprinellus aureogranulatus]
MPAQRHTHDTYSHTLDTIPASSGTSGGPVVTTRTGRLITVNPAALDQSLTDYLPTGNDTRQPAQVTPPTTDVQTQLPIINLKDLDVTPVDCLLALRNPAGYVPAKLKKHNTRRKPGAKNPNPITPPNSFIICRNVNRKALLEALARAAPSDTQDVPRDEKVNTTNCSIIMGRIWGQHMTEEQQTVYANHYSYLKQLYQEIYAKSEQHQNGEQRVQVGNGGSTRKASSLRRNAASKEPMEHPKRAAVNSKPRRTTKSRKQACTSQEIVGREVPHASSDGIGQPQFLGMNDAAQGSVHRHAYDGVPFQRGSFSPYSDAHRYQSHHSSGVFRRRQPFPAELYHSASPYVYDAQPPSSQPTYDLRHSRPTVFSYATSSTVPRISATSRRLSHGSANVNVPYNELGQQLSNFTFASGDREPTWSNASPWSIPVSIGRSYLGKRQLTTHLRVPLILDSLRQYQPSQNDDYALVDPQLLAMSNEGSSAANGCGLAQRGLETNVFRDPT